MVSALDVNPPSQVRCADRINNFELRELSRVASSSSSQSQMQEESYDYAEGISDNDIQNVISDSQVSRRNRRDSQVGYSYEGPNGQDEGSGAVFDGPGSVAIPSSVSRMSRRGMSAERTQNLRRMSSEFSSRGDYAGQRRSSETETNKRRPDFPTQIGSESAIESGVDTEEETTDDPALVKRRSRRRSSTPEAMRTSVFESLSHIFGGKTANAKEAGPSSRRPSLSHHSTTGSRRSRKSRRSSRASSVASDRSVESGDERWGYSSGEEDETSSTEDLLRYQRINDLNSDLDFGSLPPSPTGSLPNIALDPIFGDTRIDIDFGVDSLDPPPQGPPSRQQIYIADEDTTVRFIGYETRSLRQWLWRLGCVISFGLLGLLGHWFPRLWLRFVTREKGFKDSVNGFVVVETPYRDISLFPIKVLQYPYAISTVFSQKISPEENATNGKASDILSTLKVVDYRYLRFALDPRSGLFTSISDWRDNASSSVALIQQGLLNDTREQRLTLFGQNVIDIAEKSVPSLLVEEIIHPFYVFQIASIILWSLDDYYYYAFCIALISFLSITSTLLDTKKTMKRMREMSRFSCLVNVYLDGSWRQKYSTDLVPGDIVSLSDFGLSLFPADMLLLSGDAIVNESMLTGESVPVNKIPIKDNDLSKWRDSMDITPDIAKCFLYAGTRIVRVRGVMTANGGADGPSVALVVRTGFNTTKGSLVRSMLFPKPLGFAFYRDSMRFIAVLTGIAGLGFTVSAVQFVRLGVPWHTILVRALDLITVVVPPALPATLSIGTSFALSRLRKSGIFCISPNRVNVSGKVNVCCFDKTGTLTEDGLDILGIRGMERNVHRFGELIENIHDLPSDSGAGKALFIQALATCHMLQVVDEEILGDPLDLKMFNFTQWKLEEGQVAGTGKIKDKASGARSSAALVQNIVRPPGSAAFRVEDALKGNAKRAHFLELGVIRTFEFVSALRRMSVVVKRLKSTSMEIYVKGAPEVMAEICEKDSFPDDYDDLLSYYTKRGYRVIAMAGKSIEGMSWLKAQRLKREQAESGLRFLGLVIFENKVKPGTTPAIQALRAAHMACRMITGDNPLTAVSVARECGLVNQDAHIFSPIFIEGNSTTPNSRVAWPCMDDPLWTLDSYSLKPLEPPPHHTVESVMDISHQDYTLVVTGDVFRWMINYAPLETLQRMLVKTQVFARMSPDEKNEVVERLQSLGYTVLMCGDGANDCAALKAADVGLSLSEAEASVAAPFTSRTPDISCVLEVIKEGRAALVTSFSCFKYMALYSLIQFTTITLLYSFASSLGDFQFLYIDLFIIIPIAVTMGRSLPYHRIHPKRPTASLVSKKVLASIVGQIIITSAVQFWAFAWVRSQSWYKPPESESESSGNQLNALNYENTTLFLVSCFQYILVAAVFSIGPPYRKPMWTNGLFMLSISAIALINIWLTLSPSSSLMTLLELMDIPTTARLILVGAVAINVILSVLFEKWGTTVAAGVIGIVIDCFRNKRRVRDGKAYKLVENGMR